MCDLPFSSEMCFRVSISPLCRAMAPEWLVRAALCWLKVLGAYSRLRTAAHADLPLLISFDRSAMRTGNLAVTTFEQVCFLTST